jgi:hypothetical protein
MSTEPKKSFNPWPAAIIAFFSVAICCAVGFVIFCSRNSVDLVSADYYEQEIRHQDQMDRASRAASLQVPAQIKYDEASRNITVALPAEHASLPLTGWIQLYRPSAAGLDQKLPLQVNAAGAQAIDARALSAGLWHVRVTWTANGSEYFCDQKLIVGQKPT